MSQYFFSKHVDQFKVKCIVVCKEIFTTLPASSNPTSGIDIMVFPFRICFVLYPNSNIRRLLLAIAENWIKRSSEHHPVGKEFRNLKEYWRNVFWKGLPPCCPRTIRATGAAAPAAPVPPAPLPIDVLHFILPLPPFK